MEIINLTSNTKRKVKQITKLTAGLVLTMAVSANAQNLLQNGGFEDQDSTFAATVDFSDNGTALDDADLLRSGSLLLPHVEIAAPLDMGTYWVEGGATDNPEGAYYIWVEGTDNCIQFSLNGDGLTVPGLTDNVTYEVSFWAAAWDVDLTAPGTNVGDFTPTGNPSTQTDSPFVAELQRADFSYVSLTGGPTVNAPASGSIYADMNWLQYSYQFTFDSTVASNNYLNLVLSAGTDAQGVAFDGVELRAVPEASTGILSTFALLGLVMMRRRK
jgi:hypothetical protein